MLAAWTASPDRFREDANAEADAVTGGYRDRLVVELAQNAVDAGGSRLWLRVDGDVLVAANDGAPLTAAGVVGLSTLRASAKRSGTTVGRYGVGFAAVLAVTDAPSIGSRGLPSVRWSVADTTAEVAAVPALQQELAARGGHVPALRLPFEGPPLEVPTGYDTVVRLPLRDAALARRLLAAVDETLPLVLPGLASLRVEDREITAARTGSEVVLDGRRWASASRSGVASPALMAGRPPEERPEWQVSAYAPVSSTLTVPQALRAPTPTDEMISLPVVLAVTAPLEPTRRRLVPGPLTDLLLGVAGEVVAELLPALDDPLPLVPTGLAANEVDAAVRASLVAALPGVPVLPGFQLLDLGAATEAVTALLADSVDGLLPASYASSSKSAALAVLGVRRLDTAAVVDLLRQGSRSPTEWREVYAALADAPDRDALGSLPVPLADGRVVTGCRGALLPDEPLPPEVAGLPLRVVHPLAAHPLLERLGAVPATAAGLLADPALRAAAEDAEEYDDGLARGVLALVRAAGEAPGWVAETLLLPGEDGPEVAGDLLLAGGLLDRAGADLPRLAAPSWLEAETACLAGVLDLPGVEVADVPADWPALLGAPPVEVTVLRDLELATDLPVLLAGLAADRTRRRVLVDAPSYSAWWLGTHGALGLSAGEYALPGDLDGLYAVPPAYDLELLRALGVRTRLADVLADPEATGDLLDRLGDADRAVTAARARAIYLAAAERWSGDEDAPDPPLAVRDSLGAVSPRAVVVDVPDLLPLLGDRAPLVVPVRRARAVADLLDLDLLTGGVGAPEHDGLETAVPQRFSALVPDAPAAYRRCTKLVQDGVALPWRWYAGTLYATDEGLAAGIAWAAGAWPSRHLLAADPADLPRLLLEAGLD